MIEEFERRGEIILTSALTKKIGPEGPTKLGLVGWDWHFVLCQPALPLVGELG